MHARAARELEQVQNVFAHVEGIEEGRDRAEVDAGRTQPDAVRRNAGQLAHEHANRLGSLGNRFADPEQLLDREHEAQRVAQR